MAQVKDKLQPEIHQKLKETQATANESVSKLGQAEIRIDEVEYELTELKKMKENFINDYKTAVDELNRVLKELETKYPNGQIDLLDGVIIYDDGK